MHQEVVETKVINIIARISAYLFHPLFLLLINLILILMIRPHWFGVNKWTDKSLLIILVGIYSVFIPGISVLMLKLLGVIKTFELKEKHERIFPLISCMIFYLWLWVNLKQDLGIPSMWIYLMMCSIVGFAIILALNNWIKVSLHTFGIVSSLIFWMVFTLIYCNNSSCGFLLLSGKFIFPIEFFLMILFIIAGWLMTSRMILGAHTLNEIVGGILVAILSNIISYQIAH
ncbi:MAG: hypothetical protein IT267_11560 [Saprospiraceae bacterium]|nr:hypothetical protein [Saprospiraceae bacterium]